MNKINGLAHDSNEDWSNKAETNTYFLLNSLMAKMCDVFVPDWTRPIPGYMATSAI
jgi:hypothetical protein